MFGLFNYVTTLVVAVFSPLCNFRQCAVTALAILHIPIYTTIIAAWGDYFCRAGPAFLIFHHGVSD
jgi:hypothetical protein